MLQFLSLALLWPLVSTFATLLTYLLLLTFSVIILLRYFFSIYFFFWLILIDFKESDPLPLIKKHELEMNDIASSITRCQNPLHLKFADFVESFAKGTLFFIPSKTNIIIIANDGDDPIEFFLVIFVLDKN